MANRKKRQRNMDPELERWIKKRARRGDQPIDIYRDMQKSEEWSHLENLPILRTVQSVVKDQRIEDRTAPWDVADEEFSAEDVRLILDVLADVIVYFGERRTFTRAEARWVLRVRKLAPGLFLDNVWDLARYYMLCDSRGESTEWIDAFLAFMPWKNANRRGNYVTAIEQGRVESPEYLVQYSEEWAERFPRYFMKYVNLSPDGVDRMRPHFRTCEERLVETLDPDELTDWIETEEADR